ncbi:hypothetical protein ASD83_15590 [Devosia sp. Root685]|nr:hypothetical protein ASD83_15590 [Devosia sp. Root685]
METIGAGLGTGFGMGTKWGRQGLVREETGAGRWLLDRNLAGRLSHHTYSQCAPVAPMGHADVLPGKPLGQTVNAREDGGGDVGAPVGDHIGHA